MSKSNQKSNVETVETVVETVAVPTEKVWNIHELMVEFKTKSAVIRHLDSHGVKRGQIVKIFESGGVKMIYQHVRNVLITPIKKTAG